MSWSEFLVIFGVCAISILACRAVPLFLLKGKELPENISHALNLIPPAAFAALVANDLFSPEKFSAGLWPILTPLLASLVVVIVAVKTKSLLWCVVTGVSVFGVLLLVA